MKLTLLLDTHILVWWRAEPKRLSKLQASTLAAIDKKGAKVAISAITLWELAKLVELGRRRINVPLDAWLEEIEDHPGIEVLPITARVVAESTRLGEEFHRDPADQLIVATARCHGLRLVTSDERIRAWGRVPLV